MVPSNSNGEFLWSLTLNSFIMTEFGEAVKKKVPDLKTQSKCLRDSRTQHLRMRLKATMPTMCFCLSVIRGRADKMGLGRLEGRVWRRTRSRQWSYDRWNPLFFFFLSSPLGAQISMKKKSSHRSCGSRLISLETRVYLFNPTFSITSCLLSFFCLWARRARPTPETSCPIKEM